MKTWFQHPDSGIGCAAFYDKKAKRLRVVDDEGSQILMKLRVRDWHSATSALVNDIGVDHSDIAWEED